MFDFSTLRKLSQPPSRELMYMLTTGRKPPKKIRECDLCERKEDGVELIDYEDTMGAAGCMWLCPTCQRKGVEKYG